MASGDVVLTITDLGVLTNSTSSATPSFDIDTTKSIKLGDYTPSTVPYNSQSFRINGNIGAAEIHAPLIDLFFRLRSSETVELGHEWVLFDGNKRYTLTITEV